MIIFRIFFVLLIWGLGLSFLMLLIRYIVNSGNRLGSNRVQDKLQKTLSNLVAGLVPFSNEEKRELGRDFQETEVNKSFSYGYFSTIFKEPLLAFAKVDTTNGGCQIMGQTTDIKCELRNDGQRILIYISDKPFGKLNQEGTLTDIKGKVIVKLDCNSYPLYDVIMKDDRPAAYMEKEPDSGSNKRFFTMFNSDIELSSEVLVIYILFYKLIKTKYQNA